MPPHPPLIRGDSAPPFLKGDTGGLADACPTKDRRNDILWPPVTEAYLATGMNLESGVGAPSAWFFCGRLFSDPIAHAPHSFDTGAGVPGFLPQSDNLKIYGTVRHRVIVGPDCTNYLIPSKNPINPRSDECEIP